MLSRRAFLVTGGAAVALIGPGSFTYIASRRMDSVREPWRQAAKGFGDVRLNALAYAILAPNPHNRQPWQIRLEGSDEMAVYCDLSRTLPETDPPCRQITIGFGAFLELLRQAAAEQGYRTEITPFPEGEPYPVLDSRPIAHVRLIVDASVAPDPLFGYALERRTNRAKYNIERVVPAETVDQLTRLSKESEHTAVFLSSAPETVNQLKDICLRGWAVEVLTPRTLHESTRLTRIGSAAIAANPDGVSLSGPVMEIMKTTGILNAENMDTSGTLANKGVKSFYDSLIEATPTFGWMTTPGNSRADQLQAGARWVRLQLAATKLGIAMQPLSQVLQEFPEMSACYDEIHTAFGIASPARIQGLFRFGYADQPPAAPRWPLSSRLLT